MIVLIVLSLIPAFIHGQRDYCGTPINWEFDTWPSVDEGSIVYSGAGNEFDYTGDTRIETVPNSSPTVRGAGRFGGSPNWATNYSFSRFSMTFNLKETNFTALALEADYAIHWTIDGNNPTYGPERFSLGYNGEDKNLVSETTFAESGTSNTQCYHSVDEIYSYPCTGNEAVAGSGTIHDDGNRNWVYPLRFNISKSDIDPTDLNQNQFRLNIYFDNMEGQGNEAFYIDAIRVRPLCGNDENSDNENNDNINDDDDNGFSLFDLPLIPVISVITLSLLLILIIVGVIRTGKETKELSNSLKKKENSTRMNNSPIRKGPIKRTNRWAQSRSASISTNKSSPDRGGGGGGSPPKKSSPLRKNSPDHKKKSTSISPKKQRTKRSSPDKIKAEMNATKLVEAVQEETKSKRDSTITTASAVSEFLPRIDPSNTPSDFA